MPNSEPHWSENDNSQPYLGMKAHEDPVWTMTYLPDGRAVTGSKDELVKIWNTESGEEKGAMKHRDGVRYVAASPDGTRVVSGGGGRVKVWDAQSLQLVAEWIHPGNYLVIAVSPDSQLVAVGNQTTTIYTMQGRRVGGSLHHSVCSLAFSPDGSRLACGGSEDIRIYDTNDRSLILGPLQGHGSWIRCLQWSRDGSRLYSGSNDTTIRCWNTATGEQVGQPWTGHSNWIYSLSLSPDGSILASASSDKTVRFWDPVSGRPVAQPLQHVCFVFAACFSPSSGFVASAGADGLIYLWRAPQSISVEGQVGCPSDLPRCLLVKDNDPINTQATTTSVDMNDAHEIVAVGPAIINDSVSPPVPSMESHLQPSDSTFLKQFQPFDLTPSLVKTDSQYIGGGSLGDVYKCSYKDGSVLKEVAVKAFRFRFTMEGDAQDESLKILHRELGIQKRLNHVNIVPFLGIAYGFGTSRSISLVSLWMPNQTLHKFLEKYDDNLALMHRLQLMLGISNGLQYLHSSSIVHGELNSNNVLLDADYTARLSDFGYASLVGNVPEAQSYLQRSTARPGALRWNAPEQIDSEGLSDWTTKSDIYSFGCVALQVLTGKQPWSEVREDTTVTFRLAKGRKPSRPASRVMDDSYWDLIQSCWSPAEERPTTELIGSIVRQLLGDSPKSPALRDVLALVHSSEVV